MKLMRKELDAILWIVDENNAHLGRCEIEPYRDEADVGWLYVTIQRTQPGTSNLSAKKFRVSPLGHVYIPKNLWETSKSPVAVEWDPSPVRVGPGSVVADAKTAR